MSRYWENRRKQEEKEKFTEQEKNKFHKELDEELEEFEEMKKK